MKNDLKTISQEIKAGRITFEEAAEKYKLASSSKSHLKRWLLGNPDSIRNKTKADVERELQEHYLAFQEMEAKKKRPIKYVFIHGKRYIDVTADWIDCGGLI